MDPDIGEVVPPKLVVHAQATRPEHMPRPIDSHGGDSDRE